MAERERERGVICSATAPVYFSGHQWQRRQSSSEKGRSRPATFEGRAGAGTRGSGNLDFVLVRFKAWPVMVDDEIELKVLKMGLWVLSTDIRH